MLQYHILVSFPKIAYWKLLTCTDKPFSAKEHILSEYIHSRLAGLGKFLNSSTPLLEMFSYKTFIFCMWCFWYKKPYPEPQVPCLQDIFIFCPLLQYLTSVKFLLSDWPDTSNSFS